MVLMYYNNTFASQKLLKIKLIKRIGVNQLEDFIATDEIRLTYIFWNSIFFVQRFEQG